MTLAPLPDSQRSEGLLDILIPYYRGKNYLEQTVRSVLAMPHRSWRLTVVDDASSDHGAQQVLATHAIPFKNRVRLVRNRKTLGVAGNFNRCIELAQAPFCTILGADDLVMPHYAQVILDAFHAAGQVDVVQPGVSVIDSSGAPHQPMADRMKAWLRPKEKQVLAGERFAKSLMHGNWLYFPSLAWRTSTLRQYRFDSDLATAMDLELILEMICDQHSFYFDPTVSFKYRRHEQSVSSQNAIDGSRFLEERELYDRWAIRFREVGWLTAARAASLHMTSRMHALSGLPTAVRSGRVTQALRHALAPNG